MQDFELARRYIFGNMHRIKGYLGPIDALAVSTVLIGQKEALKSGGIAEIGIFFGRSFLLMASLVGKHEKALAADLFAIGQSSDGKDSRQLATFLNNAKEIGLQLDRKMIFVGDSRNLDGSPELLEACPLRFVSIDGGHNFNAVTSDANLASKVITDFGVICFDDFCAPGLPDVTLGVIDFLRFGGGAFTPFVITQNKLFVCRREYHDFYVDMMLGGNLLNKVGKKLIYMKSVPVLFLHQSFMRRARYEAFVRAGLGRLNECFY
jgi:hypothetical protein